MKDINKLNQNRKGEIKMIRYFLAWLLIGIGTLYAYDNVAQLFRPDPLPFCLNCRMEK